ncbi:hypothetical protein GGR56DRAFT_289922 [Xylariaceae sp. FL0804]|nr:hypothetical protein GGR56DRAFT_289922 [Xylariaceae sp. FL0804]
MQGQVPSVWKKLSYPLFGCDFADADQLVVGGGGGAGFRSGFGNKISLLDTSSPAELSEAAHLELSQDEDSVTSLAVGPPRDGSSTVFAGVNAGPGDVKKGKNEHFRVLSITQPAQSTRKGGEKSAEISEVARNALFVHKDPDAYQRVARLCRPFQGMPQLGAVATGLAKQAEIALFDAPSSGPATWKSRARFDVPKEAMDLDVVQTGKDTYQLAYCDDHELFTVDVTKEGVSEPTCIYTITSDESLAAKAAFRSIRYLTPGFILTLVNLPKAGASLLGFRMPDKARDQSHARLTIRAKLPRTVTKATGLAVRDLSPVASPEEKQGETQFVVAVAGMDKSISLYTLEHRSAAGVDLLADLAPFQIINSVHPSFITALSFSPFTPPEDSSKTPQEPSIKLASVSAECTAVVHRIPLKKHVGKSALAKEGDPPAPTRYVVALKSKGESPALVLTLLTIAVLLTFLVGQTFMEAKGLTSPILGVKHVLPASWTVPFPPPPPRQKKIGDLLSDVQPQEAQQLVIKHEDLGAVGPDGLPGLHVGVHDEDVHGPATPWEDMKPEERDLWKQRLKQSGHWMEDMGETIFKGVLFGEIGGAIGNMIGEAL